MREGLFIRKNKDSWERIEAGVHATPDEMAKDFTKLVDDLSYAKTFYPSSRVTPYINALAARIYLGIYRNRKEPNNKLYAFFRYDVPRTMGKYTRLMQLSLVVFLIFGAIGFFSSVKDPAFVRQMLGDEYVNMTLKNIEEGNPFEVYADSNAFFMWIRIMFNNLLVAFTYFFKGILFGFIPMVEMAKFMVGLGAFEHMFYKHGLGGASVLAVMLHGTLELTGLVITCGAALVLGTSPLFPGTGSRMEAFKRGAKDGVKIMVSQIPVFVMAAFIEGYITRYYKMPPILAGAILALSGGWVIWYFVYLPMQVRRMDKLAAQAAEEGAVHA